MYQTLPNVTRTLKLAKIQWTLANGESPNCESHIGEDPITRFHDILILEFDFKLVRIETGVCHFH